MGRKGAKSWGKFRHWWWNSAQIVQRAGRRVGWAAIQRRWILGEPEFMLPILEKEDAFILVRPYIFKR